MLRRKRRKKRSELIDERKLSGECKEKRKKKH